MDRKLIAKLSHTERNRKRHRRTALKVDDEVIVIAGKEKGKRGKILYIDRLRDRVYVQGVNKIKRFVRPTQENPQGGQVELEAPIHISNVMYYDAKLKKGVRIGYEFKDGKKVRVTRPGGREI
jgi:large subunit ribosomal protein L24